MTAVVFTVLSFGPAAKVDGRRTDLPLPFDLLGHLPVVNAALPARLALVVAPVIGVLLAYAVDQLRADPPRRRAARLAWWAGFALALLPLVPTPLLTIEREPIPRFITAGTWQEYVSPGGVLTPVPLALDVYPDGQRWQAYALAHRQGEFAIPAGFFLGPGGPDGRGRIGPPPRPFDALVDQAGRTGLVPIITEGSIRGGPRRPAALAGRDGRAGRRGARGEVGRSTRRPSGGPRPRCSARPSGWTTCWLWRIRPALAWPRPSGEPALDRGHRVTGRWVYAWRRDHDDSGLTAVRAGVLDYQAAWDEQRRLHEAVVAGERGDTVLLLEHPSVYTAGKRTEPWDRPIDGTPVVDVDRGGKITWHGPGQLVGYPIVRLPDPVDVVAYVRRTEQLLIDVCAEFGLTAGRVDGRSGVWVPADDRGPGPQGRRDRHPGRPGRDPARLLAQLRLRPGALRPDRARAASATPGSPRSPPSWAARSPWPTCCRWSSGTCRPCSPDRRRAASGARAHHLSLSRILDRPGHHRRRRYDPAIDFFVDVLGFELVEDSPVATNDGRPKRWVVVRPPGGADRPAAGPRRRRPAGRGGRATRSPAGSASSCGSTTSTPPTADARGGVEFVGRAARPSPTAGSPCSSTSPATAGTCSARPDRPPGPAGIRPLERSLKSQYALFLSDRSR